jgi:membrane-bound ClpP family serine protease
MATYLKKGNLVLGIVFIPAGIVMILFHYLTVGFGFSKTGLLGIFAICCGVFLLKRYKTGRLVIGEDQVEVDGTIITSSLINRIDLKGYTITIKSVYHDAVIHMGEYLLFSDKAKVKSVYNELLALKGGG